MRAIPRLAAMVAAALMSFACVGRRSDPVPVRDPNYMVARPIRRDADAEHTIRVDLPMAGGGYGFASSTPLLDMNSLDLGRAEFTGGRTSVVGSATIWVPLKPEANPRLVEWSRRAAANGEMLGIFIRGKLVAAPRLTSAVSGGIIIPVPSKSEGDVILGALRSGGVPG